MHKYDIGVVGLAVMGENLVLNMLSKGFCVSVYNRSTDKVEQFTSGRGAGKAVFGAKTVEELVGSLKTPRKIMMMIRAGKPVDAFIQSVLPYLSPGDILIDGGNSYFKDTIRRAEYVQSKGFYYVGSGVSGGEEGALTGPSLMPGGSGEAWPHIQPIFTAIAAKTYDGTPCCDWVGSDGAGHFVKMVHNGIEYGDMQLICEAYDLMRNLLGMTADEMAAVFADWNKTQLDSYLIEITAEILAKKDADGNPLVDKILDAAGQKGTGKWTGISALEEGVPLTLIGEAVFARCLSALKEERLAAAKVFANRGEEFNGDKAAFVADIKQALYASKIISYAQGFAMMTTAAKTYGWDLDLGGLALMWRGGCIIRSKFLDTIKVAYAENKNLDNLIMAPYFAEIMKAADKSWRNVVAKAALCGVPLPAMSSALSYFDGYASGALPANLLQAQRDYFGAHTYERVDAQRGEFFHTDWTGRGGDTAASTYSV